LINKYGQRNYRNTCNLADEIFQNTGSRENKGLAAQSLKKPFKNKPFVLKLL
jgi:hypothetical protein